MMTRTLYLFALCLATSTAINAQCIDAFPNSIWIASCGSVENLCVEQFPEELSFVWLDDETTNCVESPPAGARILRITNPNTSCDYGPDPSITISGSMGPTLRAQNPSSCSSNDGWIEFSLDYPDSVRLQITENNTILLVDSMIQDGFRFEGLYQGHYSFNIQDQPVNASCYTSFQYDLQAPEANGLSVNLQGSPFICPSNPQPLQAIINGGTPPYNYAWSTGDSTSAAISPQDNGAYSITVTDAIGCRDVASLYLEYGLFYYIDAEITDAGCNGTATGSIELVINGADINDIDFQWLDGGTEPNRYDLTAGTYVLLTTSWDGCQEFWSFNVGESGSLEVEIPNPNSGTSWANLICRNETYNLSALTTGGQPPYTYLWSDGSTSESLSVSEAGSYSVTVQDAGDCENTANISLYYTNWPDPNPSLTLPDCGMANGSIELDVSLGFDLGITWEDGTTGPLLSNLGAGTYTATVDRAGICDTSFTFQLGNNSPELEILSLLNDNDTLNCYQPERFLTSSIIDDIYSYVWIYPTGDTASTGSTLFANISGLITLLVTNSEDGCVYQATRTLYSEQQAPSANLTFNEFVSCEQPASISLATPPTEPLSFEVSFPDGNISLIEDGFIALPQVGTYLVYVRSVERGCTRVYSFLVNDAGSDCGRASGRLFLTEDCANPSSGQLVPGYLVSILNTEAGSSPIIVPTNAAGEWTAQLSPGQYLIKAQPYNEDLYTPCTALTINLDENQIATGLDLGMTTQLTCASPRVDVNIPFLRRCFNNLIHVNYCNDGPEILTNAQLVVELDSFLYFQSASIEPELVDAFMLSFELGDLQPFECGTISINAIVGCEAVLGQSHCVLAQIPLESPCPVPDDWSGATVNLNADCDDEELRFQVTNTGIADMTVNLQYVIVEDGLMLNPEPVELPPLTTGQEIYIPVEANGSTYHLITNQEPNSPGSSSPTLAVEGCGTDEFGNFSLFYLNQLSLSDEAHTNLDLDCQNNQGAFDPNDKQALPIGYGPSHFINQKQSIEYTIRFQNTGTDTAFNVVLLDTLSHYLDLTTFRPGAASHDYEFMIDSNRVLEVIFPDIMLPDSFVAPLASQGAFQFAIQTAENLQRGTRIENRAGIYFDFNEPVITSTVFHTIGKDFIDILNSLHGPVAAEASFTLFPNPASDQVYFQILNQPIRAEASYQVDIYTNLGQLQRQFRQASTTSGIDISGLSSGHYYMHLSDEEGKSLGLRQLIIQ